MRTAMTKLLSVGLVTGIVAVGGCSSDYALFNVHGKFSPNQNQGDWQPVEQCRLSVADENGAPVLEYALPARPNGNTFVGCSSGQTVRDIGEVSYSTSRPSGTLTFTIDGIDNNGKTIESGSATGTIKAFHSNNDIIPVDIVITKQ